MAKDKAKPIRCLMDATKIPPSAFALPDDGRQSKHLCQKRKALFCALALHANADGSSCFPSKNTLKTMTEFPPRTIGRLLADLRQLGVLEAGDLNAFYKTRVWKLNVPGTEPSSGEKTEPSSQTPSHLRIATEPSSTSTEPSSKSDARREDGPHTAIDLPPIQPRTHTKQERVRVLQNLNTFAQVQKYLKMDMLTSQWKRGEKEQVEALIAQHGWEKFYAAQHLYWVEQDPEQFSRTLFRWTGLLACFDGLLSKVTQEMLDAQRDERWRKEHPEEYQRQIDESIARQTREELAHRFGTEKTRELAARTDEFGVVYDSPEAMKKAVAEELADWFGDDLEVVESQSPLAKAARGEK
jgi:Helix-turn-helix domain